MAIEWANVFRTASGPSAQMSNDYSRASGKRDDPNNSGARWFGIHSLTGSRKNYFPFARR